MTRPLLLTRPRPQSEAFAAALAAALPGRFAPVIAPLLAIETRPVAADLAARLEGTAALAFTSANGVAAFAALSPRRDLPAYCVGDSTAAAAGEAGLQARSAAGDAGALAALIAAARPGPVLHLRGARAAAELARLLPGEPVRELVLYDQVPAPPPPGADAAFAPGTAPVVALFSPASAARFAAVAAERGWRLDGATALAISPAADAPLAGLVLASRVVAPDPSREGMIAALRAL
jgi:uroporphyrinogen-III synthase